MRRPVACFALVLAVLSGFVLAELRLVIQTPTASAVNSAVVHRFYGAVNQMLLTGDAVLLDALLTEDFVDHAVKPGQTGDRDGLVRYLTALHRSAPALLMTAHDVAAEGDRVVARVRIDVEPRSSPPSMPPVMGRPWGNLDLFRLREGRIAEHWGDGLGLAVAEPLLSITVDVDPPASKWVETARLTYPTGGADERWTSGPTIFLLEAGSVIITHDTISLNAATLVPSAASPQPLWPGEDIALKTGDALVLESGSSFETRNLGSVPAKVLVLWTGDPAFLSRVAPANAGTGTGPEEPPPMATHAALASSLTIRVPDGQVSFSIARIALSPGAAVASHRVPLAHGEFIIVESGRLALGVDEGLVQLRSGPDDMARTMTGDTASAGASLGVHTGAQIRFASDGEESLVALVITVGATTETARPRTTVQDDWDHERRS